MAEQMDYPNIRAIAAGTISGAFRDWPQVRPEAKALLADWERRGAEVRRLEGLFTNDGPFAQEAERKRIREQERRDEDARPTDRDGCQVCLGVRGGTKGNENIVYGIVACDDCSVLLRDVVRAAVAEVRRLEAACVDRFLLQEQAQARLTVAEEMISHLRKLILQVGFVEGMPDSPHMDGFCIFCPTLLIGPDRKEHREGCPWPAIEAEMNRMEG